MKKTAIMFFLSLIILVFPAYAILAQEMGESSSQPGQEMENPPCVCGCAVPGCLCASGGGCGMRGMGPGHMGMGGKMGGGMGGGMRGYGGCGMGPGMMGPGMMGRGMGMGMGPGAGAWAYGKSGLDATKDLRRDLHMKRFEYFEALRDPDISDKDILKLEEEIRILEIKIRRKAMQ